MQLEIRNLTKTYANGVRALHQISLDVRPGMFGLLGPNGAGKSTLMRIIATLQEPDEGQVQMGAIDVLRDKDAVRRTLGYLPQEFGLYPKVSAEALLAHFAVLKGIANRKERVEALLHQTNLFDVRKKKLGGFSGGMRQRFGIAVALLGDPELIIVDEPTAGLDPAERVRFLNLLSAIGEKSVVILSTHIVDDVADLCSRMAIIDKGEILLAGTPAEAVAALRGQIWQRTIAKEALDELRVHHNIISTRLVAGRTVVRVQNNEQPGEGFEPAQPEVEDVYFTALRRGGATAGAAA